MSHVSDVQFNVWSVLCFVPSKDPAVLVTCLLLISHKLFDLSDPALICVCVVCVVRTYV